MTIDLNFVCHVEREILSLYMKERKKDGYWMLFLCDRKHERWILDVLSYGIERMKDGQRVKKSITSK